MRFIDEVQIQALGGQGGDGSIHWRREKYVPFGGPDGGPGGNGGAVVLHADPGLNTLLDLSFTPILRAENGEAGGGTGKNGRRGDDLIVRVPVGTQVLYEDKVVADLHAPGARWVAARGGLGGRGNRSFKSSVRQAPEFAERGTPGEGRSFKLVLKSVADVGLVGFPNTGKSTLIRSISNAEPQVADYPFTTLRPTLGVVAWNEQRFVCADIPGLIPGAHEGRGLGIQFLKHVERTSVLAHLVDPMLAAAELPPLPYAEESMVDSEIAEHDRSLEHQFVERAVRQFEMIDRELEQFSSELAKLPRLIVISKCDLEFNYRYAAAISEAFIQRGMQCIAVSARTGFGLEQLKGSLAALVASRTGNRPA